MLNFLFWNLNKKNLTDNIVSLAKIHDVDVLIFAEFTISVPEMLIALNSDSQNNYFYIHNNCDKIEIFTKFSDQLIQPILESDRLTINRLNLPDSSEILIAAIHFVDKQNYDDDEQDMLSIDFANTIRDTEERIGHSRTIVVGDFNMNPFQAGMTMCNGFHAIMTKQIASKESRTVQGKDYPFFYNPMWNLFGDHAQEVSGTYFMRNYKPKEYFWYILDQVLVRPDLLDAFNVEDLAILTSDGQVSLLNAKGYPDKRNYSDHLPIKFTLTI